MRRIWLAVVIILCACSTRQPDTAALPVANVTASADALIMTLTHASPTNTPPYTRIPSNGGWVPQVEDVNGVPMVRVPAGCFVMGDAAGRPDEVPVSMQCVDEPFYLDQYEVTNAQFEQFQGVANEASQWPDADYPRQRLTWYEARAYCARRGAGMRLPTEREWEYAGRGPDSLIYPWGNALIAGTAYIDTTGGRVAAVGTFLYDLSWVGAYDMAGNVREWTSSIYSDALPYPYDDSAAREDLDDTTNRRVMRGGGFLDTWGDLRLAIRHGVYPDYSGTDFGVRCARSVY